MASAVCLEQMKIDLFVIFGSSALIWSNVKSSIFAEYLRRTVIYSIVQPKQEKKIEVLVVNQDILSVDQLLYSRYLSASIL